MRIILFLMPIFFLISCSKQVVSGFIDEVKENRTAFAFTIPAWVINATTSLALKGVKKDDERALVSLGKKIKQIRLVSDSNSKVQDHEIKEVIADMQLKDQYEPYTIVRHDGNDVYVMVREEKEIIKNLAILVHGDTQTTVLHLKTELTMNDLDNADFSWNKKQ